MAWRTHSAAQHTANVALLQSTIIYPALNLCAVLAQNAMSQCCRSSSSSCSSCNDQESIFFMSFVRWFQSLFIISYFLSSSTPVARHSLRFRSVEGPQHADSGYLFEFYFRFFNSTSVRLRNQFIFVCSIQITRIDFPFEFFHFTLCKMRWNRPNPRHVYGQHPHTINRIGRKRRATEVSRPIDAKRKRYLIQSLTSIFIIFNRIQSYVEFFSSRFSSLLSQNIQNNFTM